MSKVYGYCRVSTRFQRIERQEENIKAQFPDAIICKEAFTGTKIQGRKVLDQLRKDVPAGGTIVFDEVSRMSRNAEEGFNLYQEWFTKGVNLVFLKEPHINTDVFRAACQRRIDVSVNTGNIPIDKFVNDNLNSINVLLMNLAAEQIRIAFAQAQAEVDHLHIRTAEGMKKAGATGTIKDGNPGKISKARTGKKYETKKAREVKKIILKHNKGFGGTLSNEETWKLAGISKMTFYKYQRELIEAAGK